ncbi:hypothetical protein [Saccharothrix sp. ALI-22-I]|uniref:hypothetical protein n=1 Tax=Saccharothrix sp. ALI-22-I TaxID=1933778 RepID=UPI0015C33424|nr:hypothetical protein [Saccharothrix sp. ALI-22-I]
MTDWNSTCAVFAAAYAASHIGKASAPLSFGRVLRTITALPSSWMRARFDA